VRTAGPKKRRDDLGRIIPKSRGEKLREELYHKSKGELSDGPSIGERAVGNIYIEHPIGFKGTGYQRSLPRVECESIIFGTVTRPCSGLFQPSFGGQFDNQAQGKDFAGGRPQQG
jgi:hypothetical protein